MRTDWQYFKCDGCGRTYKRSKDDGSQNDYLLSCYSIYNSLSSDDDFEFCSDECCLKYFTDYLANHIKMKLQIESFVLDVCKEASDIE